MKRGLDQLYQDMKTAKKNLKRELCDTIYKQTLQRIVNKTPPIYTDLVRSARLSHIGDKEVGFTVEGIKVYKREDGTKWVVVHDQRYEVRFEKTMEVRKKDHKRLLLPIEPCLMWFVRQVNVKRLLEQLDQAVTEPVACYKKMKGV